MTTRVLRGATLAIIFNRQNLKQHKKQKLFLNSHLSLRNPLFLKIRCRKTRLNEPLNQVNSFLKKPTR